MTTDLRKVSHLYAVARLGGVESALQNTKLEMQAGGSQTFLPELFNLPELSSAPQEVIEVIERFLSLPEEQAETAVSSKN